MNNKIKATALLFGVLYLLYGGKLVNVWREGGRRLPGGHTRGGAWEPEEEEQDWGGGGLLEEYSGMHMHKEQSAPWRVPGSY